MQNQSPKVKNKNKKTAVDFPLALTYSLTDLSPICKYWGDQDYVKTIMKPNARSASQLPSWWRSL